MAVPAAPSSRASPLKKSNSYSLMTSIANENWGECPKCGLPVLIDPATGVPEPCGNCAAKASPWGLYFGGVAIVCGLLVFGLLMYFCIRLLVGVLTGQA